MKKISAVVAAAVLMLGLSSCSAYSSADAAERKGEVSGEIFEMDVTLSDGRVVPCVFWDSASYAGGMSCDWENAR